MLRTLDRLVTVLGASEGNENFHESGFNSDQSEDTQGEDAQTYDPITGMWYGGHLDRQIKSLIEGKYKNFRQHCSTQTTRGVRSIDFVSHWILDEFFNETGACEDMITATVFGNDVACLNFMLAFTARLRYREFVNEGILGAADDRRLFWVMKLAEMGIHGEKFRGLSEEMVLLYKSLIFCRASCFGTVFVNELGEIKRFNAFDGVRSYFVYCAKKSNAYKEAVKAIFGTVEAEVPGEENLRFSVAVTRYRAFLEIALKQVRLTTNSVALWRLRLIDLGILGRAGSDLSRRVVGVFMDSQRALAGSTFHDDGTVEGVSYDAVVEHIVSKVGNVPGLDEIHKSFCAWNGIQWGK